MVLWLLYIPPQPNILLATSISNPLLTYHNQESKRKLLSNLPYRKPSFNDFEHLDSLKQWWGNNNNPY